MLVVNMKYVIKNLKINKTDVYINHIYLMVLVGSILVRLRLSSGIHKGESLTSNNKNWKMTDAKGMVFNYLIYEEED